MGAIGEILLIDPQAINIYKFEKEYNIELKRVLKEHQHDFRFNKYVSSENINIVELSPKVTKLRIRQGSDMKFIEVRTLEVKCKRKTSRVIVPLITEAKLNSEIFGVFLQAEHKKENTETYNSYVVHHSNLMNNTARMILNDIPPSLMQAEIPTNNGTTTLINTLYDIEDTDGNQVFKSIVNLAPNDSSWILNTTVDQNMYASRCLKAILDKFVNTDTYKNVNGPDHRAEEHLYVPRQIQRVNEVPNLPPVIGVTTQVISQRTSNRRYVAPSIPSSINRLQGTTWSSVVSGVSPTGSTVSIRSDISLLQEQNELLMKKVEEVTKQNIEVQAIINKQHLEMVEQEQRYREAEEKRKVEQDQRERDRQQNDQEREKRFQEQIDRMMTINDQLTDQNRSLSEQLNRSVSAVQQNTDLVNLTISRLEQSRLESQERDQNTRNEMKVWVSHINARVYSGGNTRGEKRTSENLQEDNNICNDGTGDTNMGMETPLPNDTFTPRVHPPNTPAATSVQSPMDYTPPVGTVVNPSSLVNASQQSSLSVTASMANMNTRTPVRNNSLLNQSLEELDFDDCDEDNEPPSYPADPPDLAGKRL